MNSRRLRSNMGTSSPAASTARGRRSPATQSCPRSAWRRAGWQVLGPVLNRSESSPGAPRVLEPNNSTSQSPSPLHCEISTRLMSARGLGRVKRFSRRGRRRRKAGGMDRQTLRDWAIRFNEQGPEGLISKPSPGAPASSAPSTRRSSPQSSRRVRSRRSTAWCAGGRAI
jgi:hypothetical protein